jgi:hypothetical protein
VPPKHADLGGANLHGARLGGANVQRAGYDAHTTWPKGFDPDGAGAWRFNKHKMPGSVPPAD